MSWLFKCCCKVDPDDSLIQTTSKQPANYGAIQPVDGARAARGREDMQERHPDGQDNQAAVLGNDRDDQSPKKPDDQGVHAEESPNFVIVEMPDKQKEAGAPQEASPPRQPGDGGSGQPASSRDGSCSDSGEPQKKLTTTTKLPSESAAVEATKTKDAGSAVAAARTAPLAVAEEALEAEGGSEKAGLGEGDVGRTGSGKDGAEKVVVSAGVKKDEGGAGGDKTAGDGADKEGKGGAEVRTKDSSALGSSQEQQGAMGLTPGGDTDVSVFTVPFPDVVTSSTDQVVPSDRTEKSGGPAEVSELEGSGETLKASDVESSSDTVKSTQ